MKTKTCTTCKLNLSLNNFHKVKGGKFGVRSCCIECSKGYRKSRVKLERSCAKARYKNNREYLLNKTKEWQSINKEKVSESRRKWNKNNKGIKNFHNSKRRAKRLKATLQGFDIELKEIYKNRPEGYHVDHIVPLQGKNVCGLHVPWNLQYLAAEENLKKGNKL